MAFTECFRPVAAIADCAVFLWVTYLLKWCGSGRAVRVYCCSVLVSQAVPSSPLWPSSFSIKLLAGK